MAEIDDWMRARVRAARDLSPDVRMLEIEPPPGRFVPPSPGSHLRFSLEIAGRPDRRSYSVVGPCEDGVWRIAVKRLPDSRGGSRHMGALEAGAHLLVSGPHNHFSLSPARPAYLLLAGGIGITPLVSMAHALQRKGAAFRLLYAARSRAHAVLADELREAIGERLELYLDSEGQRIDFDAAFAALPPGGEAYVCGPIGMLEAARRAWVRAGRPPEELRFETFGNSGAHAAEPFRITIPRLGRVIEVPRDRTMLEALEAAGVEMIHDCRRGECGICALDIVSVEGEVDHRDVFFSDEEKAGNAKLCTCVSRVVRGDIVLDTPDRFE
ncbi:PDR/VanB family oxidoreductase [Aureimonas sp. N4]|uniref:PDR/VanB family oxidoreductase n=1 Tax=Aureimonas sp. N4 TaxID=1638165 RepID=UPI000780A7D7|nr:PDR/VanB family oxidoreductase [Aureimonas sp. N4]